VNNNPVRYNDPTGHRIDDGCDGESGGCTLSQSQKNQDAQDAAMAEAERAKYLCQTGNENYCPYVVLHPWETAFFVFGTIGSLASLEYLLFGGGLTGDAAVSLLARFGTHNAESSIVSLGGYGPGGYIEVAKAAGNGYTYFSLPNLVYKAAIEF